MKSKGEQSSTVELLISAEAGHTSEFFQLLQQGVILRKEVGCSVRSFLYRQLKLPPEFVEDQIKTIFLDGKPVDDLDAARVRDGCTLALSAAMPGLVGATMRRGGYYASLRSQISHSAQPETAPVQAEGFVTLKLFNLIAECLGKTILEDGVFVKKEDMEDFFSRHAGPVLKDMEAMRNGMTLDWETFRTTVCADELVRVRLKIL